MSLSRTNLRNRQESTSTERRKLDRQATQRVPSSGMPPPGTIMGTCGWWLSADPCVKNRENADLRSEMLGVCRDGGHGLGRSLEQDVVDRGLVLVGDVGDLGRQREHDVEVRHRQKLGLALGKPRARCRALALGAMPVTAAVVGDGRIAAGLVLAARNMAPEGCRAAVLDRRHDLELAEADMAGIGPTPYRPVVAEDIRDLQRRTGHRRGRLRRRLVFLVALLDLLWCLALWPRQAVKRALHLGDHAGGNMGIARRRFQFGMA